MSWRNQDIMGEPWHEKFCTGCDNEIGTINNPAFGDLCRGCWADENPEYQQSEE